MENYRIFVEKRGEFNVEARSLLSELNENLGLSLSSLRLLNVYDLFGFTPELLERSRFSVFGEVVTDEVSLECDLSDCKYIAIEYLPGQFDQRAASAEDCVRLIDPLAQVHIKSAKLLIFEPSVSESDLARICKYSINAVESREKDLSALEFSEQAPVSEVPVLEGFISMKPSEFSSYCAKMGLAMSVEDLGTVVEYFKAEGRDPVETELRILDTYWSDHCRHTTFNTILDSFEIEGSFVKDDISKTLERYCKVREELGRGEKPKCLMDIATIGAKYLRSKKLLGDVEVSEENNACSIFVDAKVDGRTEKWLLLFKNETHNHPTEIEPFGGAATCLGGAIRDPLAGRGYVYQAMRLTGAGDVTKTVAETHAGKLPQRVISRKAALGYSSYGNQIGLATTNVHEMYHPGYEAKRLEIGAVVGAVKAKNVRRESPAVGDVILLLGGRTGRDGIGGATGSSKTHTESSIETCGSEVQKGNPPEERKLQRLMRRAEVVRMIKKANDFGAGGVSVAVGELTDGLDIYLDRVPTKYSGLNATELAISESQERLAVVIRRSDMDEFMGFCASENVEATHIADVTDSRRMRMYCGGRKVCDISREFINSAGASRHATVKIGSVKFQNPFVSQTEGETFAERLQYELSSPNHLSQKGLAEMFDSTVGRSTVLMPFGGMLQTTPVQVSVQKLPTDGYTDTASIMAWGCDPYLGEWSPYHAAAYAFVDACAKVVSAGGDWSKMRFSCQEYFEKMTYPHSWGLCFSALLGAFKMQEALSLPSIGGKDSMSGTFEDLNVPPTLAAFGITTIDANDVISPELKWGGNMLYLIRHIPHDDLMPDICQLKSNWDYVHCQIKDGNIVSAYAVGMDSVAASLCKMAFGNGLGVDVHADEEVLWNSCYGSIIVESEGELDYRNAVLLGKVTDGEDGFLHFNGEKCDIFELMESNNNMFGPLYPSVCPPSHDHLEPEGLTGIKPLKVKASELKYKGEPVETPIVYIPVFPGTNCDYDTAKAFRAAGAEVQMTTFRNLSGNDILGSIVEMKEHIASCHIFALAGGFSAGDEPDGSGKFIANILNNKDISEEIEKLLGRGGLILGICNGFQALVKSGLLPYGRFGCMTADSPTLFRNDINRHISQIVTTSVASTNSPWLAGFTIGQLHTVAVSHGEGKFVVNAELARELFANGQVAFRYADPIEEAPTMDSPYNPNGSYYAIEGIIGHNGQILGKMGHTERYENNLFKNIVDDGLDQPLFENAVRYFRGE